MKAIPELDHRILTFLAETDGQVSMQVLVERLELDQSQAAAVIKMRSEAGELRVAVQEHRSFKVGRRAMGFSQGKLPERQILQGLEKCGGQAVIPQLANVSGMSGKEVGQALRWLKAKKWAEHQGKSLSLTPSGRSALKSPDETTPDEALFRQLWSHGGWMEESNLEDAGVDLTAALQALKGRGGVVEERVRKEVFVSLSASGLDLVRSGVTSKKETNRLTTQMMNTGSWRDYTFRPYDVGLGTFHRAVAKRHPLTRILEKIRRVFLEMGFDEIQSSHLDSSFWVFDALFQPQDHPAREMQDTFFIRSPQRCRLPDAQTVARVQQTHEDGGQTGSIGWRYAWSTKVAAQPVLRTHTTAATIRRLAKKPNPPQKIFCVGPVFRRETVDYKHLPMFNQVEGVVVDEKASFAQLIGVLKVFYKMMGFDRVQFRPAYFPYTEPSLEVFVWLEGKQDWVEMGGAGIFRPEVTRPMGCAHPVLAWGLGLERLAMIHYGLNNLSQLYQSRLSWLEEVSLCR